MFLCRRLVLVGRGCSICRFSSSHSSSSNLDCRPLALQARVDFLIRLPDLDNAAKHARLAVFSSAWVDDDLGNCAHLIDQTCNAIIGAMCEAKRYRDALDLFNYFFRDSKIKPFRGYFNHMIKYHLDQGRLADALDLYDSSLANSATESLITKALVFSSLASDVCYSLFQWLLARRDLQAAFEVSEDLEGRSYAYEYDNVVVLGTTLMEFWFEKGNEEEALKFYSELNFRKVTKPSTVNALLELLFKYGKKTQAWTVLEKVLDSEEMHNLDSDTMNIMVNESFKMGRFKQAIFHNFKTVKALKLKHPRVTCYKNIITKFNERNMLLEAEHFFEEMCSDSLVEPDVSTYITMINAYRKAGRNEDALRIANEMVDAFLGQVAWLACV